jgi:hypothetical protein
MNELQKRIIKTEYKPGCFVLASFQKRDMKETQGDFRVKTTVSFVYDAGIVAAEWEPEYGPIQVWEKCDKDADNAREHYFYDFTNSPGGNWSQMAVDSNQLPQAANRGDYDYIFSVLKEWTDNR